MKAAEKGAPVVLTVSVAVERSGREGRGDPRADAAAAASAGARAGWPHRLHPQSSKGGGELSKLLLFSPSASTVIQRAPEWRMGEYWRVDWFKELEAGYRFREAG